MGINKTGTPRPGEEKPACRAFPEGWLLGAGTLVLAGWLCVQVYLHYYALTDDAFIFFRYAHNVLMGQGPVFNPGQRVEGFTSPLYLALLTLLGGCGLPFPLAAAALGLSTSVGTLVLLLHGPLLSLRAGYRLLAALLTAAHFSFTYWASSGMETSLFAFLLLATLARVAHENRRQTPHWMAGGLSGLLLLTRPEGLLLWPIIILLTGTSRRSLGSWIAGALLLPVLYQLFRLGYYHAWGPNTAWAKIGLSWAHLELGLAYVQHFWRDHPFVLLALLPLLLVPRRTPLLLACYGLLVLSTAYIIVVGGDFFEQYRFFAPYLPIMALLAALGVQTAADRLHQYWLSRAVAPLPDTTADPSRPGSTVRALAVTAISVLLLLSGFGRQPVQLQRTYGLNWVVGSGKLGLVLARRYSRHTWVACAHIGALGFYSRLPILDLLGLTDAHIARQPIDESIYEHYPYRDIGHEKFDIPYSLAQRPQLIVPIRSFSRRPPTHFSEIPRSFAMEHLLLEAVHRQGDYKLHPVRVDDQVFWTVLERAGKKGRFARQGRHEMDRAIPPSGRGR